MAMKRSREDGEIEALAMANCLMLLSRVGKSESDSAKPNSAGRVFVCKTCNREFPSFQALGGHRASHKRPRHMAGDIFPNDGQLAPASPAKPKTHECSICGLEFAIGQALGGHMRRHKAASVSHEELVKEPAAKPVAVLKKSNSKRVLCLDLGLGLGLGMGLDLDLKLGMCS